MRIGYPIYQRLTDERKQALKDARTRVRAAAMCELFPEYADTPERKAAMAEYQRHHDADVKLLEEHRIKRENDAYTYRNFHRR